MVGVVVSALLTIVASKGVLERSSLMASDRIYLTLFIFLINTC